MTALTQIYKWTNFSIHTGVIPNVWELQFAFDYCVKAFEPDAFDKTKGFNIHSSIKISDYEELKRRFEKDVTDNLKGRTWQFLYESKPEAVIA